MDIILDTTFNNPRLPVVERPGFVDDFHRAAGQGLGTTVDGKTWEANGSMWSITETGRATRVSGADSVFVDALASDGTLTAVLSKTDDENRNGGVIFRRIDDDNYLYYRGHNNGGSALYSRVDGATDLSQITGDVPLEDGDIIEVTMTGPDIVIRKNGTQVTAVTYEPLMNATQHGLIATTSAKHEWDSIEFVA